MTLHLSSTVHSLYLFTEYQSVPDGFLFVCFLKRSGFFAALLDTRPSSRSLGLTVHADALTPACCQSWASSALVALRSRSWIIFRRQSWCFSTFSGTLKPFSQQLNLYSWSSWWSDNGRFTCNLSSNYILACEALFMHRDDSCMCFLADNHG